MALDPPLPFRPSLWQGKWRGGMGRCTTFWPTHSRPSPSLDDDIGPLDLFTYDVCKVFGFFTPPPPPTRHCPISIVTFWATPSQCGGRHV